MRFLGPVQESAPSSRFRIRLSVSSEAEVEVRAAAEARALIAPGASPVLPSKRASVLLSTPPTAPVNSGDSALSPVDGGANGALTPSAAAAAPTT